MAFLEVEYFSDVLGKAMSMNVLLPQTAAGQIGVEGKQVDATYPTLYLLHGMSDDQTGWMRYTSIERYAREHGLAVVMPNADLSFYCNMKHGLDYFTQIADEVPAVCHDFFPRMSQEREQTFIGGLSMGGYGALKLAFARPERFSHAICLSGVNDIGEFAETTYASRYRALENIFGDRFSVRGSDNDLFVAAEQLVKSGRPLPRLYMWCGMQDELFDAHCRAHKYYTDLGFDVTHSEAPGMHAWNYWDEQIKTAIDQWLPV